jgi:hypothetical protein
MSKTTKHWKNLSDAQSVTSFWLTPHMPNNNNTIEMILDAIGTKYCDHERYQIIQCGCDFP